MIPFKNVRTETLRLPLFLARFLVYIAAAIILFIIPIGMNERQLITPLFYISRALPVAIIILVVSCFIASLVSIDDLLRRRSE